MLTCELGSTDEKQACLRIYKDCLVASLGPMIVLSPSSKDKLIVFLHISPTDLKDALQFPEDSSGKPREWTSYRAEPSSEREQSGIVHLYLLGVDP